MENSTSERTSYIKFNPKKTVDNSLKIFFFFWGGVESTSLGLHIQAMTVKI